MTEVNFNQEEWLMKKFVYIAALAASAIAFSCTKEINEIPAGQPVPEGAFTLTADVAETKVNFTDAETYTVDWDADDVLGVYVTSSEGTEYILFHKGEGENVFYTSDFTPVEGETYTYSVVYPAADASTLNEGKVNINIESGYQSVAGDTDHIQTPLYGTAKDVEGTASPAVTLSHAATVVKVNVTNAAGAETFSVNEVSIVAESPVAGVFSMDVVSGELTASETASNEASVSVNDGVVAETGAFYILCAPFTGNAAVKVTTADKVYEISKTDLDFKAGYVYTTVVACSDFWLDGTAVPVGANAALTQTVENEAVYAWYAELQPGTFSIRTMEGVLTPENGAFAQTSEYTVSPEYAWTVESAGKYRVVVDTENAKVTVYDPANDLKPFKVTWYKRGDKDTYPNGHETTVIDRLWYYGAGTNWKAENNEIVFTPSLADPQILVFQTTEAGKRIKGGKTKFYIEHGATFAPGGDSAEEETFGMSDWFIGSTRVDENNDGKHDTEGTSVEVSLHRGLDQWTPAYGGYDQRESWFNLGFWPDTFIIDLRNMRLKADEVGKY